MVNILMSSKYIDNHFKNSSAIRLLGCHNSTEVTNELVRIAAEEFGEQNFNGVCVCMNIQTGEAQSFLRNHQMRIYAEKQPRISYVVFHAIHRMINEGDVKQTGPYMRFLAHMVDNGANIRIAIVGDGDMVVTDDEMFSFPDEPVEMSDYPIRWTEL